MKLSVDSNEKEIISMTFDKDVTGSGNDVHENSAAERDGGTAVPPYVTLGHSGCVQNSADKETGCGPDNEDGRGLLFTGMLQGSPFLFAGSARTIPDGSNYYYYYYYDYIYFSKDTDSDISFKYIDLNDMTGIVTSGLQSLFIKDDRIFAGMVKINDDGFRNTPDFSVVSL